MVNFIKKYKVHLLFALLALLFLVSNRSIVLWNQDEAAYAGFAKTMIERGDFLIPDFIWSDAHRKTPLHFWFISFFFSIFGYNEFACRLSSSIFVFATLVLLYRQCKYFFNKDIAFWAVAITGTNFFVPALAKVALTDGSLLFFSSLTGFSILHLMEEKSRSWLFYFWFAIACGLLLKGPQILIFAGFFSLAILLFHPDRIRIWRLQPWFYFPLAILPLLLWGYLAWQKDEGEFIQWLIDWYILRRVSGSVYGQTGPPGYYLATFLLFFLPWLPFVAHAIYSSVKSLFTKEKKNLLPILWLLGGWLIYEALSSKLPSYVLASYPALAILASISVQQFLGQSKIQFFKIAGVIQFLLFLALTVASPILLGQYLDGTARISLTVVFAILSIGSLAFLFYTMKLKKNKAIASYLFAAILASLLAWTWVMHDAKNLFSGSKDIAKYMEQNFIPSSQVNIVYSFPKLPSTAFYISRNFPNYFEDQNLNDVKQNLDGSQPYIAILKEEQLQHISQDGKKYLFEKIRSYVIDRQVFNDYYIVYNTESLLKSSQ